MRQRLTRQIVDRTARADGFGHPASHSPNLSGVEGHTARTGEERPPRSVLPSGEPTAYEEGITDGSLPDGTSPSEGTRTPNPSLLPGHGEDEGSRTVAKGGTAVSPL